MVGSVVSKFDLSLPGLSTKVVQYWFCIWMGLVVNLLRPGQMCPHYADDIFKYIFLIENVWVSLKISIKFILEVRINNIPALVHIMAWCRPGDKSLFELKMVSLLTQICVTWPQWVKWLNRALNAYGCKCHKNTITVILNYSSYRGYLEYKLNPIVDLNSRCTLTSEKPHCIQGQHMAML